MSNPEKSLSTQDSTSTPSKTEIQLSDLSKVIDSLIEDQSKLKDGYQILQKFEYSQNFYMNTLKLMYESEKKSNKNKMKLCGCIFIRFLKKN